ncbi:methyltransferase, partial [Rhizobium sp. CRIBSB]|nr:methyltransferase [Rhizobium sp. CRIBSB]
MDAALLAAGVVARPGERIIEAGCGAGGALFQVLARRPGVLATGLERDSAAALLAQGNAVLNGAEGVSILHGDIAAGFGVLDQPRFDWAIANPPFFDDESALRAPSPERKGAWIADDGLAAWTDFL